MQCSMQKSRAETCAIAVMAKVPTPGKSKTRLLPILSADQAASLSAAFLRDTTENIARAARDAAIDGHVAYAPSGLAHLFEGHLADGTKLLLADGSLTCPPNVRGFGACLYHAIVTLLDQGYGSACVLNSDGPTLPTCQLTRAAELLAADGDRVVIGPAEDGGYYLLGMKARHAQLFADIDWSTDRVAAQTRARAVSLGLDTVFLDPWYDVDEPAELQRLIAELERPAPRGARGIFPAPATAHCLDRLGLRHALRATG